MIFGRRALSLLVPSGDVRIDAARCVRRRFSESKCSACASACSERAITFDPDPALDASRCTSCRRCETACPTGAIAGDSRDIAALVVDLVKQARPVLGCRVSGMRANVRTGCLGFLGVEGVIALGIAVPQGVTLNVSRCGQCRNASIVADLQRVVREADALAADCVPGRVRLAFDDPDDDIPDASLSRRGFFAALGKECAGAATSIAPRLADASQSNPEGPTRSLPAQRRLLVRGFQTLPARARAPLEHALYPDLAFGPTCNNCTGCDGMCPTGAISTSPADPPRPVFHPMLCTSCAVCVAFCPKRAIELTSPPGNLPKHALGFGPRAAAS